MDKNSGCYTQNRLEKEVQYKENGMQCDWTSKEPLSGCYQHKQGSQNRRHTLASSLGQHQRQWCDQMKSEWQGFLGVGILLNLIGNTVFLFCL